MGAALLVDAGRQGLLEGESARENGLHIERFVSVSWPKYLWFDFSELNSPGATPLPTLPCRPPLPRTWRCMSCQDSFWLGTKQCRGPGANPLLKTWQQCFTLFVRCSALNLISAETVKWTPSSSLLAGSATSSVRNRYSRCSNSQWQSFQILIVNVSEWVCHPHSSLPSFGTNAHSHTCAVIFTNIGSCLRPFGLTDVNSVFQLKHKIEFLGG